MTHVQVFWFFILQAWIYSHAPLVKLFISVVVLSSFSFLATPHGLWNPSSQLGIEPGPQQWKCWVLTNGPPENSSEVLFLFWDLYLCWFFFYNSISLLIVFIWWDMLTLSFSSLNMISFSSLNKFIKADLNYLSSEVYPSRLSARQFLLIASPTHTIWPYVILSHFFACLMRFLKTRHFNNIMWQLWISHSPLFPGFIGVAVCCCCCCYLF